MHPPAPHALIDRSNPPADARCRSLFASMGHVALVVGALITTAVAQEPAGEEVPSVFLDVSTEARTRLGMVDSYIKEKDWFEAVELLQTLLEAHGDKVVPLDPKAPRVYVNLRTLAQYKLSQLPPEGLRVYRDRVDSQANQLMSVAIKNGDDGALLRVAREFFCSTAADQAIERLGDRAASTGRYIEALSWWSKVLPTDLTDPKVKSAPAMTPPAKAAPAEAKPDEAGEIRLKYPGPKGNVARVAAKWVVAQFLLGNRPAAEQGIAWIRTHHPNANGRLAGREGKYWQIVENFAKNKEALAPASADADWLTFAGNPQRNKRGGAAVVIGDVEWNWNFADEQSGQGQRQNQVAPIRRLEDQLPYHPVIVGQKALMVTERALWSFDLETGRSERWSDFDTDEMSPSGGDRYTLTVSGRRVFLRTGDSRRMMTTAFPRQRPDAKSKLYCYDHLSQKLLWWKSSPSAGDPDAVFEGAPLASGDNVYIAMTRHDAMSETSVVCLDAETGNVRWRALVCESTNDQRPGNVELEHNLLTLADDILYYCTNLGAVAAVDTRDGSLRWVTTYPRGKNRPYGQAAALAPDINPCVYHQGKVFAAPADTSKILCFDAESGQKVWEAGPPVTHLLGVAKGALIATGNRAWAIDVETGKIRWYFPENTLSGYGRGLLAGDWVYWPTRTEIHVLDQSTGRPVVRTRPLLDQPELRRAGNMVMGHETLIIAQSHRLLAITPYARREKKLIQQLVEQPNSAALHLQLAQAAANHRKFDLAIEHFQQAARLAGAEEMYQRESLADHARVRLYDTLRADAAAKQLAGDRAGGERMLTQAIEAARNAEAAANSPRGDDAKSIVETWRRRRLDAIAEQARFHLEAGSPVAAAASYQSVLDAPELRALLWIEPNGKTAEAAPAANGSASPSALTPASLGALTSASPGALTPASVWAEVKIAELIAKHGAKVYAKFESDSFRGLENEKNADQFQQLAERYPNSSVAGELLLRAAAGYERARRPNDARNIYKRLLRRDGEPNDRRLAAMLGLRRTYAEQRLTGPEWSLLQELLREYSAAPIPGRNLYTVRDFVAERMAELPHASGNAGVDPLNRSLAGLHRLWSDSRSDVRCVIPAGQAPITEGAVIVKVRGAKATICRAMDGRSRWDVELPTPIVWAAYAPAGLILASSDRISCHGYDSGNLAWERSLNFGGHDADWKTRALSQPRFALAGESVVVLHGAQSLSAFDIDDGRPTWTLALSTKGDNETVAAASLESAGGLVCVRTMDRLLAVGARDGRQILNVPLQGGVHATPIVFAGDKIVVITDRATVSAFDRTTGARAWKTTLVWPCLSLPLIYGQDQWLLAVADGHQLIRLDPQTGSVIWRGTIGDRPVEFGTESASIVGEQFLFAFGDWLESRSLKDGRFQWRQPLPKHGHCRIGGRGSVAWAVGVANESAYLLTYDASTGRPAQAIQFANANERHEPAAALVGVGSNGEATAPTFEASDRFALLGAADRQWVLELVAADDPPGR